MPEAEHEPAPAGDDRAIRSLLRKASRPDHDTRLREALGLAGRATRLGLPILLCAETGSGKEVTAREIHARSGRGGAFVAVNCGALPASLAAAELFGYVEGAYTGARRGGTKGRIQEADGGTLLLDEIGDMPLELQVMLLRFLDDRSVRPVGSGQQQQVDVQVIAATNVDLRRAVAQGRFRQDLYFRLNTIEVTIPPLREREDFEHLVCAMWSDLQDERPLTPCAVAALRRHSWPGNIRELRSILYRLHLGAARDGSVSASEVARELENVAPPLSPGTGIAEVVQVEIDKALQLCEGNVSAAARRLGVSRSTLYRKMQK